MQASTTAEPCSVRREAPPSGPWLLPERSSIASSAAMGEGDRRPAGDHAADDIGVDQAGIDSHHVRCQRGPDAEADGQPGEPASPEAVVAADDHRGGPGDDETVDRDREEEGEPALAGVARQVKHVGVAGHRRDERHRYHGACRCPAHRSWHVRLSALGARRPR